MKMRNKLFRNRWIGMVLAGVLVFTLTACNNGADLLQSPTEPSAETVSIETLYGVLAFPESLYTELNHTEVTEENVAMEIFTMVGEEGDKEIYRIYYAAPDSGTLIGYLQTDSGEISVSYSLSQYDDSIFESEEERRLYYSMMDAFSVIMNSIDSDERFSESRPQAAVGKREVKLRYWTIPLPDNIQYEETDVNGDYRVDFYSEVSGERIDLYSIGLGQLEADTTLGMYTVDGEQKPVMVSSATLDPYESWPQEEQNKISQMMESLNEVLQVIVSDENFA